MASARLRRSRSSRNAAACGSFGVGTERVIRVSADAHYLELLRAARLGYSDVRWYRGGIQAWGTSGGALADPRIVWQRPPAD